MQRLGLNIILWLLISLLGTAHAATLTITKIGNGTIESSGVGGVNCGSTCTASYASSTTNVTLTAYPDTSSSLVSWIDLTTNLVPTECPVTNPVPTTCTISNLGSTNRNIKATFSRNLTITKSGTGTVTSDIGNISCGATCSAIFTTQTSVTLTAAPQNSSVTFLGWQDVNTGIAPTNCTTTSKICSIDVSSANRNIKAIFSRNLTVSKSGNGTVTSTNGQISCGASCSIPNINTTTTFTLNATSTDNFIGWTDTDTGLAPLDCPTSAASCTLVVSDSDRNIRANFSASSAILDLQVLGTGKITTSDNQTCYSNTTCPIIYNAGSITLTASPMSSYAFVRWVDANTGATPTGTGCSNSTSCTISVGTFNQHIQTIFTDYAPTTNTKLTISTLGAGLVSSISSPAVTPEISCGGTTAACSAQYSTFPTTVVLTAAPGTPGVLVNWIDKATGIAPPGCNSNTCVVTMTGSTSNQEIVANFTNSAPSIVVVKQGSGSDYGRVTSTPSGINCGGPLAPAFTSPLPDTTCSINTATGTGITFTAAVDSNAGAYFAGWEVLYGTAKQPNLCTGLATTCHITKTDLSVTVKAKFDFNFILNIFNDGSVIGNVTLKTSSNLQSICNEALCSQTYPKNTTVTLTANSSAISLFQNWVVDGVTIADKTKNCGNVSCVVTMDGSHTVRAVFSQVINDAYSLMLLKSGSASAYGAVTGDAVIITDTGTRNITPIDCGSNCSSSVNANLAVTFTASKPEAKDKNGNIINYHFSGWTIYYWDPVSEAWVQNKEMCTGTETKCIVTMAQNAQVFAKFDIDYADMLSVVRAGNGSGSVVSSSADLNACTVASKNNICTQTFVAGQKVILNAIPDANSGNPKWSGDCDPVAQDQPANQCIVSIANAKIVTVTFDANSTTPALTININNPASSGTLGSGTVKSDKGGIVCTNGPCSQTFVINTTVVLTAVPDNGSQFAGWEGGCTGFSLTCTIAMTQATNVNAKFNIGYKININNQGSGQGSITSTPSGIDCGSTCEFGFASGTKVTLTATAANGSANVGWGGDCQGQSPNSCVLNLSQSYNVSYTFTNVSLGKALDNQVLQWTTTGDALWFGQTQKFYLGNSSAVSGTLKQNQQSTMQSTVIGPGKLTFYWQVASDTVDKLTFSATAANINASISGSVNWEQKTYDIPDGSHVLTWTYTKKSDATITSGSAWVDKVEYTGQGNIITISNQGSGFGTVTSNPMGINCGSTCTAGFKTDSAVKLTANPIGDSQFAGWSGDGVCSGTSPTCLVTANSAHTVTAIFNLNNSTVNQATLNLGLLNDTGIDWCANNASNFLVDKENKCISLLSTFPNQDGQTGRDAAARKGQLFKAGKGDAGFDYTKICNNGDACLVDAVQGAQASNWGCTRDNVTGLIWEIKTNDGLLRDKDITYSWYVADDRLNGGSKGDNCTTDNCNTASYVNSVNQQGLCGANDWRLPTRKELHSIVHHGQSKPAVDISFFPDALSSGYWSATPAASLPFNAWFVSFDNGWDFWDNKTTKHYVRLVRTCENCIPVTQSSTPVYQEAQQKLNLPVVNVEGNYYLANLVVANDNPLTFDLTDAKQLSNMIPSNRVRYYLNGMLEISGVVVGDTRYNAILQLVPGSNPLRFELQEAHIVP